MSEVDRVLLDETPAYRLGAPPDRARVGLLAVHGRGQDAGFIREVLERVGLDGVHALLPESAERSWYPQRFMEPVASNQPHLDRALAVMFAGLEQLRQDGVAPERTVLLGFSQGACLLSQLLLSREAAVGAAVLLTGGYLGEGAPPAGPRLDGLPVLMSLVDDDPFVPLVRAEETATVLRERGAEVDLRVRPGTEHEVHDDEVAAVRTLLDRVAPG